MEQSSFQDEQTVRHQFDSLCKLALKSEVINYEKHMAYRQKYEVMLSELSEKELSRLFIMDEHEMETHRFQVLGYDIEVKDALIAEALQTLTEKKRNVVLLSYFMECREKIRGAAMFLFELVNDVLDMSKMESGEIELEKIPFDLREMLDEVVALIEVQAVERGIHFTYKRENYQHYKLIGSPVHLRQIMLNIAGNAVKYNRENGSLDLHCEEVSCSEKYAMYEFTCVDTGKGMSKEFQKHMFEPFTQEENGARTTLGGTGLGLSIVKKLVEKMNGEIDVVSEEGKGTTFTINLPLKINPDAVEEETSEKEEQELSIAGLHILLVEDNELNMEIAEFLLEDEGAVLTKAWNGQEAVDIFKNSPDGTFDVILMDIMMPVMDGLTATRTIRGLMREEAERIPIIAMTANAFEEDRKRSMEAGMNGHVAKPLDMQEILKTIVDCIQHK